jgi:hypothetical protein
VIVLNIFSCASEHKGMMDLDFFMPVRHKDRKGDSPAVFVVSRVSFNLIYLGASTGGAALGARGARWPAGG